MLNIHQKTLDKIKSYLKRQQKHVESQIKSLEKEDPVLSDGLAESPESGTESWSADVHARFVSMKNELLGLSKRITNSLTSLKKGTYGKCERCGKKIEVARLDALPTASLCLSCSKKTPSRTKR